MLFVPVSFSGYLRPSEADRLCLGDVIPPVQGGGPGCEHYSLLLAPFERAVATKTQGYDEALMLDDARAPLDALSIEDGLTRLTDEDHQAVRAVEAARPALADAVRLFTSVLRSGGRILAAGAGTSGRLATLDFSELPPTCGADPSRFVAEIEHQPAVFERWEIEEVPRDE